MWMRSKGQAGYSQEPPGSTRISKPKDILWVTREK